MRLFRVMPHIEGADPFGPGGVLHVPEIQGAGRLDNPDRYRVLYVADSPAGAVGEAFGNHHTWTPALLRGRPALESSITALATYETDADLRDLDDPHELAARDLPPSRVVTRDRRVTQRWALAIWGEGRWGGVRWWSYWHPEWGSAGLWEHDRLEVSTVEALHPRHAALLEAAAAMNRPWRD